MFIKTENNAQTCIGVLPQAKGWVLWSAEHSQLPFTAAALGDTKYLKSSASCASYAFKNVIQQDHKCQLFPVICVWFAYSDFTSSFLCSSHDVKGLVVPPPLPIPHVQKSCRESTLDLHPQDVGQENCSLAGGSLWLLSIPFTLFNRHKVNLADLRIGVRSTLRAEHILSLVLVHANELLAPFSQVDDVCTFSRASLKYKGRAKEFQCTWWLVPSAI